MSLFRTLIGILFLTSFCLQAQTELRIRGLSGELEQNVNDHIATYDKADISGSLRFQMELQQDIETALQALGYYHSEIEFTLAETSGKTTLQVDVVAGEPTRIHTADIQLSGDATEDRQFGWLLRRQAPEVGDVLHHGKYESLKSELRSLALRKGYFDAEFSRSTLEVIPELHQANIYLHFDSGNRYKFGEVTFSGQQIRDEWMQSLIPFEPDQPYLASELGEFNQTLANTNWFSSISIEGDTEQIDDYTLPILVKLEPRLRNSVETGIGYSDVVGPRLKVNWLKPWLNDRGHSLHSKFEISEVEQTIESAYRMPLSTAATDYYQLQVGFRNRDTLDTRSKEVNVALERHWLLANEWYRTVSLRYLYEDFIQADQDASSSLIMPGISFSRSRQSQGNMPRSADRLLFGVEFSEPAWASDTQFVRLRGRAGWIGSYQRNHRFVSRLDAGAVVIDDITEIPPSLRFFAGGDNNIRGYGYETIAPVNNDNELIGGRYMVAASLEYQYRVKGNWWVAGFFDYGSAWNDSPDFKRGVGLGIRWGSPVGPVRLDFGYGLDSGERNAFQIHFALGPEL
ncbi:autotransporter secretion outer membrane protein TamA [Arsukibacterium tuosuense]|uniref:Translocation and assembly module subunit TamA n=1 Tax=Arsukibacterium tuosuense TaxID=1323745 RepID=A0A285ISV4_9GAMM|nr:autotransporter assembly complex family protein [Arsukibacterium tuosuense]SNY51078.1 autotransporter secretion outer membrane protein TamA [Arsukibacterium tuosuense]